MHAPRHDLATPGALRGRRARRDPGLGPAPAPDGAGHDNDTARTIGFREGDAINEAAMLAFFRQIIANNRAGGWRKLKARR